MGRRKKERRREERHPRNILVHAVCRRGELHAGELSIGRTLNLSVEGARMVLAEPLAEGTALDITLQLGDRLLDLGARVIYSEPSEEGHAVGVEFRDLSEADRGALEEHLGNAPH